MPVMDGFQSSMEIRKTFTGDQVHIAALTAYASEAFEKKCMDAGMDTFLTKPVNDAKLKILVKKLGLYDGQ